MDEEVKFLNEIEKKRNEIRKEAHEKFMDGMLDKMGAPVKWIGYKSMFTFENNILNSVLGRFALRNIHNVRSVIRKC